MQPQSMRALIIEGESNNHLNIIETLNICKLEL